MGDITGRTRIIFDSLASSDGQLADAPQIALKSKFKGMGNLPSDIENVEDLAETVSLLALGSIPPNLQRWNRDTSFSVDANAGVSNPHIIFDTSEPQNQPVSIDYFSGTSSVYR